MADLQVATTILEQMGGKRFVVMTGARKFLGDDKSLTFSLPRNARNGIVKVRVTLTPADEYNMVFFNRSGVEVTKYDGIYCDQLQELFTNATGLYTRL